MVVSAVIFVSCSVFLVFVLVVVVAVVAVVPCVACLTSSCSFSLSICDRCIMWLSLGRLRAMSVRVTRKDF